MDKIKWIKLIFLGNNNVTTSAKAYHHSDPSGSDCELQNATVVAAPGSGDAQVLYHGRLDERTIDFATTASRPHSNHPNKQ